MSFGIVGPTGPGMREVVRFEDRYTERGTFGANLGRAIVTNGYFTAYVCNSTATRPSSKITLGKFVNVWQNIFSYRLDWIICGHQIHPV